MQNEIPLYPPIEWFTPPPSMPKDAGCIVDANGRVYGYLCHWGSVLMDGTDDRWKAPRSKNEYAFAHTGDTKLDDGTIIKTANLGGDFGHAPVGAGDLAATQAFYENTQTQLARVRYGEDAHGVWFAGSCWPNVSELDVAKLRASARSGHWAAVGDWRDVSNGRAGYELVGACLVNVPGLKYARADRAASGVLSFNPIHTTPSAPLVDRSERVAASGTATLAVDLSAVGVGGILLVEGIPTEDGRLIDVDATTWRDLPLPLYASLENLPGHDEASLVGRIDSIWRDETDPKQVMYLGVVFPAAAGGDGQETLDAIGNQMLTGISIDGIVGPDDCYWNENEVQVIAQIVVAGATLTPMPAIQDATVTLLSTDTERLTMSEDAVVEEQVDEAGTTETLAVEEQVAALSDQIASIADRVEYLIGVWESAQMSARYEAASAKIRS